jgi:acyl-CoA synthetase (AMP-forming)/AMP-acid ligase II
MHLIDFFDHGAGLDAKADCLVENGIRLSYSEVSEWTHRIAWTLHDCGIKEQGRVAILSPNNLWGYVAILGLQRAGCIWVPLSARSALDEIITHLNRTHSQWLFYHSDFEIELKRIQKEVPTLLGFVCIDKVGNTFPDMKHWSSARVEKKFPLPLRENRNAIFRITSSGGTTGAPKAVVQTQVGVEANMAAFMALTSHAKPRYLLANPMTHAAGIISFNVLARGGTVYIIRTPEPQILIDTIEHEHITMLMLTPTSIYSLLSIAGIRKHDFSSLKYFILGAAPMSAGKLREALEIFGPVMMQIYAQTEASTLLAAMLPTDYAQILLDPSLEKRLLSCGRPAPFSRLAIMDNVGNLLPRGEQGELVVRGGMVMRGYWEEPELDVTASQFGWHHTGDIAYFDEAGYVYLVDRIRDLIISGGFNVFPSEVEQVIWTHPAVQDCAVIGVPDEKWGEAVKAVIELKPGCLTTEEEIIKLCKEKLGSVKSPKSVEFWRELPRSPLNKVLKKKIREFFLTRS